VSVTAPTSAPAPATNFSLLGAAYEITPNVDTNGSLVTVCISYNPAQVASGLMLSLLHYSDGNWTDITWPQVDQTVPNAVCGQTSSFSIFALAESTTNRVAACNGVTLSGNAMIDSYNSSNGSYASQVGAGGDVNVLQTCTAGANITLSGNAAVYGNALATGSVITSGRAKVYGSTSQNQPISGCAPLNFPSMVERNRPSGSPSPITLSGKQTRTLFAPGSFYLTGVSLSGQSMLTVSGTGNATMFIDGDLSISGQASFIVPKGVTLTIFITGNISIAGGGIVNQGPPSALIIYASASKGSQVTISGNSELACSLYAPLSNISVTGNSAFMGVVRGMTVTGSGNAGFHYDVATK